jgi:hypothetical protein
VLSKLLDVSLDDTMRANTLNGADWPSFEPYAVVKFASQEAPREFHSGGACDQPLCVYARASYCGILFVVQHQPTSLV